MSYKIVRVGVDTRDLDNIFPQDLTPDVIVTSPIPGNDFLIEPTLPREENELVVVIDKDISPSEFLYHSQLLGRGKVDTVLLSPNTTHLEDYIFLKDKTENIGRLGIYKPSAENLGDQIMPVIDCIGIEIGPLNFDYELIKKCEDNGKEIIGFCDLSEKKYPDTYNLSFYARYCNTLILSSKDGLYKERERYIKALSGEPSPKEVELEKSIHLIGETELKIGASIKLGENLIIPLTDNSFLGDPEEIVFSLGRNHEKLPEPEEYPVRDRLEEAVYNFWDSLDKKEELGREEKIDTLRYVLSSFIDTGYNIGRISRHALIFVVKRYKERKSRIYDNYLLYITESGELYFRNLKNTLQDDSNSY